MAILWPVFPLVFLTAFVAFRLGFMRFAAVRRRAISAEYFRSYRGAEEPESLVIASRHLVNLFEQPLLFYVAAIVSYVTGATNATLVALAWAYVLLRIVHSYIHLGPNVVIWRFRVFALAWLVLVAIWLVLLIRLLRGG